MELTKFEPPAEGQKYRLPLGLTLDVPAELYHADDTSTSKSTLHRMSLSPAHCKQKIDDGVTPNKEMNFGTIVDHLLYTPDAPPPYVLSPYADYRKKEAQAWRDAQVLPVATEADFDKAGECVEVMLQNENFAESFESGIKQLSMKASLDFCSLHDVALRGRPDFVPHGKAFIVDLKTTGYGMAERRVFEKNAFDKGYHWQAALYLDLWNALNPDDQRWAFKFHVIEREKPYATSALFYEEGTETIIYGRRQYRAALAQFEQCSLSGKWPGYPVESIRAHLPEWALKRLRNEE